MPVIEPATPRLNAMSKTNRSGGICTRALPVALREIIVAA